MDDCVVHADVWSRIIILAPLESVAVASRLCRYTRALVAQHWPTLALVPQAWIDFTTDLGHPSIIHLYQDLERYQREARYFVRELVRWRIHEIPGITLYTRLMAALLSERKVWYLSLENDDIVGRIAPDSPKAVIQTVDLGLNLQILYLLHRHDPRTLKIIPATADYTRWATAVFYERSYANLYFLFLDPMTRRAWEKAKEWMTTRMKNYPDDRIVQSFIF